MKKKLLALVLVVALVLSVAVVFAACEKVDLGQGDKKITVWMSEKEGVKSLTEKQISKWLDGKEGYRDTYTFVVEGVTESEAATNMVTDVASGADIYCFAQDQLARLVEANALSKLDANAVKFVSDNNDAGSVKATSVGKDTYCYPITSDNGYFMYYDKSVVKQESIGDLAKIVADCKAANRNFSYELGGSAWYNASFFFGAGCTSAWTFNGETNKWKATDDFNSAKGLIAMKGMQILTGSGVWVDSSKAADFGAAIPSAVVVTGTWDAGTAKENLGDNYAVAKLPSYTVDGHSYQLGSFSGYKLMGVKPNSDATIQAMCHELAQELSGKEAQEARFDGFSWGPSNKAVQAMDKVKSDEALSALAAQNAYAVPQGQIHGGWWDAAKLLGSSTIDENKAAVTEAKLQEALTNYAKALEKFEKMTVEEMNAFTVIGHITGLDQKTPAEDANIVNVDDGGKWDATNWKGDYKMVESPEGTWKSAKALVLAAGDEFQVRQGQSWDLQFGALGEDGYSTKNNFVVETAGTYYIQLVVEKDENGKIVKGKVSLVAAQ